MTGLFLGPRGSCTVSTIAAMVPVVRGSFAVTYEAQCPGTSPQEDVLISSRGRRRVRWPGIWSSSFVLYSATAGSRNHLQVALHMGGIGRVESLGWARRLDLLPPIPQGNR